MEQARLLVLSDIHLGSLSEISDFDLKKEINPESVAREATAIKKALNDQGLKPNTILVPGDLTSQGTPQEFSECCTLVRRISEELGISASRVIITYGNHDVDWKIGNIEAAPGAQRNLYCQLGALTGSIFAPPSIPTQSGNEVGSGLYEFSDLTIIVLNSGRFCYPLTAEQKHEYHHGKIGPIQLAWLRSLPTKHIPRDRPCLLMLHHHLINLRYPSTVADISTLEEGAEVISEIGRLGVDIVIHGHRHHPIVYADLQTGWAQPVTFLCAGSYGVSSHHRASGMIPNTFHFLEFKNKTDEGNYSGRVTTFERVMDRSWKVIPDGLQHVELDGNQGFGSAVGITTITQIISSLIQNMTLSQNGGSSMMRLPSYDSLDIRLHSLRIKQLNQLFMQQAEVAGYEITGSYPNTCILTPISE